MPCAGDQLVQIGGRLSQGRFQQQVDHRTPLRAMLAGRGVEMNSRRREREFLGRRTGVTGRFGTLFISGSLRRIDGDGHIRGGDDNLFALAGQVLWAGVRSAGAALLQK